MSDTQIQDGKTMAVGGIAASMEAGEPLNVGGYVGPLLTSVRGTSDAYNTGAVQGFPLSDGVGSGKGDIALEGVWAFAILDADQGAVAVGDPMFLAGASTGEVDALNTGAIVGHVYPQDDLSAKRVVAADDPLALTAPGMTHVVYVKLFGRPKALA